MYKKFFLFSFCLILISSIFTLIPNKALANDVQLDWAKRMGGVNPGGNVGFSVMVDSSGNTYTSGWFAGTADFDPGTGVYNLTSRGDYDIFVTKLDPSGNFVWAKQMGGTGDDKSYANSIDTNGNVYVEGSFSGTANFNPGGTYNLTAKGSYDGFIVKLDNDGNFVWAKQIGGIGASVNSEYVVVDSNNNFNVYITGSFIGTVDFDPGAGVSNMSSSPIGVYDIFVYKLDSSGNFIWAKQMGGTGTDISYHAILDSSGNIYTTGIFQNTADFDPGAGTYNLTSAGSFDIFVSKLDSSGNFVWIKQMGGTGDDRSFAIKVDSNGNVYTTGWFSGTTNFNPSGTAYNLTSAGAQDIFISKFNSSGNFVWVKQMGGAGLDYSDSLFVDSNNYPYISGAFSGTANFNPEGTSNNLISAGNTDIFIAKFDSLTGSIIWVKQIGGINEDDSQSVVVDVNNNIYSTGFFSGTVDFDPSSGISNLISAGSKTDIYILKLTPTDTIPESFSFTDQIGVAKSTVAESNTIIVSGINNITPISIDSCTGTICEFSINSDTYTVVTGTVVNGDTIKVHQTSSNLNNTITNLVLNIGGVTDTFSVTTIPDTTKPIITLLGQSSITITAGQKYTDLGATALDDIDGDITSNIVTVNHVDKNVPGTYIITYNVSDTALNQADQITRTVNVIKKLSYGYYPKKQIINIIPTTATILSTETLLKITKVLKYKMTDSEVRTLQIYLNTNGYPISLTGPGSLGHETNYFGSLTKAAVIKFQIANHLVGDGVVGPMTRRDMK